MHLWEVSRPIVADDSENLNRCASFADLRSRIDALAPTLNQVYAWEWYDATHPLHDGFFMAGEDRDEQVFNVFLLTSSRRICYQCPIDYRQEREVLEWLRGPRILGALRQAWAPLLND